MTLTSIYYRQEWPSDARVAMLRLLAYGAKEDDIVLILHMDRKDHSVMNYAQSFDRLAVKEQESIAPLVSDIQLASFSCQILLTENKTIRLLTLLNFSNVAISDNS